MKQSSFVWFDKESKDRNSFALFRRRFNLKSIPRSATINLFADTVYRMRVNGTIVAYGPARFIPQEPTCDSVDLVPYLRSGSNVVTVEVNAKNASTYQSWPSIGGFIAWGKAGTVDLTTPGEWKVKQCDAWDPWAPSWSFAQGPGEIVDMKKLPAKWFEPEFNDSSWKNAVLVEPQNNWGDLKPRSIPMLAMEEYLPQKVLLAAKLSTTEERIGCRVPGSASSKAAKMRCCYATHLYSPEDQTVTLGLFWGPHYLNGKEITPKKNDLLGNREDYDVQLKKGWNFLYGEPELLAESWGVLIAFPSGKGIVASDEPRFDTAHAMRCTQSMAESS